MEGNTVVNGNVVEDAEVFGIRLGTGDFTQNLVCASNLVANSSPSVVTQAGIAVSNTNEVTARQLVANNIVQMKAPSAGGPGDAYGLVAVDGSGSIIMTGGSPTPVTTANFPRVTVSANSIYEV